MDTWQLIEQARSEVDEVAPVSVAPSLSSYLVVDVREPREVLYGYLPAAINVPRGVLEFQAERDPRFRDASRPILIYSGRGNRSLLACRSLKALGYDAVVSLAGGFERWQDERFPVV